MIRRVLRAPVVLGWLLWNVVLSSVALAKEAVTPGPIGTPVLVRYPMHCRTDVEITALAWAITVTPGTLVTVIGDDEMWVHVVLGGPRQEMIELLGQTEDRVLSVLRGEDE
ncbi:Na+/H+ antiporter subunit E [Dietzia maris]|uniref:Na+/H+ antiporter subunit E n=1 Tax=Dietzia TaxID=37914 RepID=UPI0022B35BA9|nr:MULTISPECIES: Na+/H+ antiporter subunit E [Dietzia]MBB0991457.1 Na+/H+ antiporter subunit E [Dietzia sp. SLG510A3-30A2]MBB0994778.1 Na+/H+ antiporter subunit E [Dietzia sp. SLG510A3-40A3]MBB1008965.1 Na+/H+ antiporter subunit E [Dietzia sp. SLG510A3-3B2-2]MCZ4654618.1 Na+/H+ antiporter subunit E [Dietzia kunjamensis]MDJ0421541.1 Na+/H+ antiporter subunit E [Dietzia kunjamensis]